MSTVAQLRESPPPAARRSPSLGARVAQLRVVAERDLLKTTLVLAWSMGAAMQVLDMVAFGPVDWSDWTVLGICATCAVASALVDWQVTPLYWVMPLIYLGLVAIFLAALTGGPEGVVSFTVLPALIATVFFWRMPALVLAAVVPSMAVFVAMGLATGNAAEQREVFFIAPLLPLLSLLLGALYNATRSAMHEQGRMRGTVAALLASLEARDGYTADHSSEVLDLVRAVAARLRLDGRDREVAAYVGLLHDIGKIGIPNSVLNKQGPLDDREWEIMRQHPVIGEQIVREIPGFDAIADAVRHEHERWDGGGYPDGISGTEIPVAARIVLACDAYHAMTSDRPYRRSIGHDAAQEELRRCAGSQFDPIVVEALIEALDGSGGVDDKHGRRTLEPARKPLPDSLYVGDQDHGRATAEGTS